MTVNLEKIFFVYILKNKKYFNNIEPFFFKNPDVKFVYGIIKEYMNNDIETEVPSPKQIAEMVRLKDKDNTITKDMLLSILKEKLADYDEEKFIKPKFNTWILINRIKSGTTDIIDDSRELDDVSNYNDALTLAGRIKEKIIEATSTKFDSDDSLGSDFDDAESHSQDNDSRKIKTGWESMDTILGGGFDLGTLSIIMGTTGSGKCFFDGYIYIRNKITNKIEKIKIEKFFRRIKKRKSLNSIYV